MIITATDRKNTESALWQWLNSRTDAQIVLVLLLVLFAVFANSLRNRFVYDDHILIESNSDLRDLNYPATVFTHSVHSSNTWLNYNNIPIDYYRPFTRLLFWVAFQFFGLNPVYWHLLNLIIYSAVAALAYAIVKQLSDSRATAATAALLFAVHPIHSEAAAWVNCLVETLHALFFLSGFLLFLMANREADKRKARVFYIGSLALLMAALLSKETALCFPILVAAYSFINSERGLMKRIRAGVVASIPFLLVVVAYLVFRYFVYGNLMRADSRLPLNTILLTIPGVIVEYLRMMVLPLGLSAVHSIGIVSSLKSISFWLPLIFLVSAGLLLWKRASSNAVFAGAWILITMLPVLNIGVFTPDLMLQDRYAFLPSLGICAMAAIGVGALLERSRMAAIQPVALIAIIAAAIGLGGLAIRQNRFWYSDLTLFARSAEQNQNSEIAQCSYGWVLYDNGQKEEAARRFSTGFKIKDGRSPCSCWGLGKYYFEKGEYNQAVQFYETAVNLKTGDLNLLILTNLANAYSKQGRIDKAIELLDRTLAEHPNFLQARELLEQLTLSGEAEEEWKQK